MTVVHIVQFQFKTDASPAAIKEACQKFLALKEGCILPATNKPYLKSLVGGKDNSPEGLQMGLTHAFVVEFESVEDRDYYVHHDPTHQAFVKGIGGVVEKAQVLDFTPGVFE